MLTYSENIKLQALKEEKKAMERQMMIRECYFCGCWFQDKHSQGRVYVCDKCCGDLTK